MVRKTQTEEVQTPASRLEKELAQLDIKATSQESRFHTEAITTSTKEVDLKDVNLAVGERQLLQDAHLRLKEGVHYGLVGRNGTGKSTLLRALSDGLIPGLPPGLHILLVSQLDSELKLHRLSKEEGMQKVTVMDAVLQSDKRRVEAERDVEELGAVLDAQDLTSVHQTVSQILLQRSFEALEEARRISAKRSGQRGAVARKRLIEAERHYEEAKADTLDAGTRDWLQEAAELHANTVALLEQMDSATITSRAYAILQGLGFTRKQIEGPYLTLSGGWKARVALASALLQHCDILVLDEPTNYLDMPSILWLQKFVSDSPNTIVTVAHDIEFLNSVTEELMILRNQTLLYHDGNLFDYNLQMRRKFKHAKRQQEALDKKKKLIEKSISDGKRQARKTGDENRQRMVKSREKKLEDRWGLEASASGHRFRLHRDLGGYHLTSRANIETEEMQSTITFHFPDPEPMRFAGPCLHVEKLCFSHPGKKVFQDVNLTMHLGDRVGLVGPNGHGKTTLLEIITGKRQGTSGTVTLHSRLRLAYFAQDALTDSAFQNSPQTALQYFLEEAQASGYQTEKTARSFLSQFDLRGRSVDAIPISRLSGGQRVKLILAVLLCCAPHLVLLDEVTTHMDSDSIQALIGALQRFKGAVLLISHDRQAIREIIEGKKSEGKLTEVESDEDSTEEEENDLQLNSEGRTYLLKSGRMQLLSNGVEEYVESVIKKLK